MSDPWGAWQKENIEINRRQFQDNMSSVMLDAMELECDRFKVRACPGRTRPLATPAPLAAARLSRVRRTRVLCQ